MADYLFAIWIVLSASLLVLFGYAAWVHLRRRQQAEIDLSDIVPYLLPVNLEVLSDAIDLSQDAYLRHSQLPDEFQRLQRKRARLAAEYLRRMSHNAALLQQVGYAQLRSSNPVVADQAQELIDAGVHVRLYALLGIAALFFRRVWGLGAISAAKIFEVQKLMSANLIPAYDALRSKAEELTSLRDHTFHDALVRSL
jgi:hypothetical protein